MIVGNPPLPLGSKTAVGGGCLVEAYILITVVTDINDQTRNAVQTIVETESALPHVIGFNYLAFSIVIVCRCLLLQHDGALVLYGLANFLAKEIEVVYIKLVYVGYLTLSEIKTHKQPGAEVGLYVIQFVLIVRHGKPVNIGQKELYSFVVKRSLFHYKIILCQ